MTAPTPTLHSLAESIPAATATALGIPATDLEGHDLQVYRYRSGDIDVHLWGDRAAEFVRAMPGAIVSDWYRRDDGIEQRTISARDGNLRVVAYEHRPAGGVK